MDLDVVHEGDVLAVMAALPDHSIDAIVTDPPYYRVKGEAWDRQWDTPAGFLAWMAQLRDQWYRLLKPNGSLYVFASPQMAGRVEVLLSERFHILNTIRWQKQLHSAWKMSREAQRSFVAPWEAIIFAEHYGADTAALGVSGYGAKCDELRGFIFEPLRAYLDGERRRAGVSKADCNAACGFARIAGGMASRHYFSPSQWCLPTAEHYAALQRLAPNHLQRSYESLRTEYETLRRPFAVTEDVPYTDVWDFAAVRPYPGKHVCEKPLPLCQHIVRTSTRPDAVILDCFAGSGAILDAARQEGRRYIGIERDSHWVTRARVRLGVPQVATTIIPLLTPKPRKAAKVSTFVSLWDDLEAS